MQTRPARRRAALAELLNPGHTTIGLIGAHTAKWEEQFRLCARRAAEELAGNIRMEELHSMTSGPLYSHPSLSAARVGTYAAMREGR